MREFGFPPLYYPQPISPRRAEYLRIAGLDIPGHPTAHLQRVDMQHEEEFAKFLARESDHLKKYLSWAAHKDALAAAKRLGEYTKGTERGKRLAFFIFSHTFAAPGDLLGFVGLAEPTEHYAKRSAKLGSYVARHVQGKGYALRGNLTLLQFAQEYWRLNNVESEIANTNQRSKRMVELLTAKTVQLGAYPTKASPSYSHDNAFHSMDQWSIDLPRLQGTFREQLEGCQRYYQTAEGSVVTRDYNVLPGDFRESVAYQALVRDIEDSQNDIQLAGPLTIHRDCLEILPALSEAFRQGVKVEATIPELPFYDQEKYQEAIDVTSRLKAANISTDGQGLWSYAAIIDRKVMWIRKTAGYFHHLGERQHDRWRRIEAEQSLSQRTIEKMTYEL